MLILSDEKINKSKKENKKEDEDDGTLQKADESHAHCGPKVKILKGITIIFIYTTHTRVYS